MSALLPYQRRLPNSPSLYETRGGSAQPPILVVVRHVCSGGVSHRMGCSIPTLTEKPAETH
jgi:hypothetical protein